MSRIRLLSMLILLLACACQSLRPSGHGGLLSPEDELRRQQLSICGQEDAREAGPTAGGGKQRITWDRDRHLGQRMIDRPVGHR